MTPAPMPTGTSYHFPMCAPPRTRKPPPATKYFASLRSCAPSSASSNGVVRTGGARPGRKRTVAATTTARNATYVRNCSDVRCWTYTSRELAEPGLEEVDRQGPGEVEERDQREDHPRAHLRPPRVADALAGVAVAE